MSNSETYPRFQMFVGKEVPPQERWVGIMSAGQLLVAEHVVTNLGDLVKESEDGIVRKISAQERDEIATLGEDLRELH